MDEIYFEELRRNIMDKNFWTPKYFSVYNHEAGSGKSREAQKIIAEMTNKHDYRVLYVQMFSNDGQLEKTTNHINECAGRIVAYFYTSKREVKKNLNEWLGQAQVLCITHKMYSQIAKGKHKELIRNRDILIIDEHPNIMETITISSRDIENLWGKFYRFNESRALAEMFMDKILELSDNAENVHSIRFVDFRDKFYDDFREGMQNLLSECGNDKNKSLLENFKMLLESNCIFYENCFYIYNKNTRLTLLNNNIILDANAGFDYRYKLSDKFVVCCQPKVYQYNKTQLYLYNINTSKNSLAKYTDFYLNAINEIPVSKGDKVLIIADKDNKELIEKNILIKFDGYETLEQIKNCEGIEYYVEYFGNIIGKNEFRDFDTVVIVKTPNYSYITYAMNYLFYKGDELTRQDSVKLFSDKEIESVRVSVVAGEIYQAIKRINRDNSKEARFYLFCNDKDVVDLVVGQLSEINCVPSFLSVNSDKRKYDSNKRKEHSIFQAKIKEVKNVINQNKNLGVKSISKKELRESVGIKDKSYFSTILRELKGFFEGSGIENQVQRLIIR